MARRVAWQVEADGDAHRLDAALAQRADWLSRSAAQNAIRNGLVRVNDEVETRPSTALKLDDRVESFLPEPEDPDARLVAADVPVDVIYRDDHILVVDKPHGIAVHPGPGHRDDTLVNGLLKIFPETAAVGAPDRPGVVHRLDLDTSGLLIFALTPEAYVQLGKAMRERAIKRTYTALAHGRVQPAEGTVDAPIGRDPSNRTRQAVVESGRAAKTHYRTVEQLPNATLLEVELETGRMHQIRVHLTAIGFPVLGDMTYGNSPKVNGLNRQFLHASRLSFAHPVTGEQMTHESPLPADLASVLERLRQA